MRWTVPRRGQPLAGREEELAIPRNRREGKPRAAAQGTAVGELELSLVLASLLSTRREAGVSWGGTGALRRGGGMKSLPRGKNTTYWGNHTQCNTLPRKEAGPCSEHLNEGQHLKWGEANSGFFFLKSQLRLHSRTMTRLQDHSEVSHWLSSSTLGKDDIGSICG